MQLFSKRQRILNEALVIIAQAAQSGNAVSAGLEARRLCERHPDSEMSEAEIREVLFQMAVDQRIAVDTTT